MNKFSKFKIGDFVTHCRVTSVGIGEITGIEADSFSRSCRVTWENGRRCVDPEEQLVLVSSDDIYIRFEGRIFVFPKDITDQEIIFDKIADAYSTGTALR